MKNYVIIEKLEDLSLFVACLELRVKELYKEVAFVKEILITIKKAIGGNDGRE